MLECVNLYKIISKYDTNFVFGVKIDICVFFQFLGIFFFYISVKHGFFTTCFRQSAKGKMTAWDVR